MDPQLIGIAAQLNERFGLDRTACAVVRRLKRRGKSRWMEGYSLRDLERVIGIDTAPSSADRS